MSYAVQSQDFLPQHSQEFGLSSWNIGSKIKNVLFGRIGDWKNSILMVASVFWIAKAALSFFSGSWTIALAELFTGGFLAMIHKEYRDFTNLHAATGDYRKENIELKQSNLRFKQSNLKFEESNKKFEASNKKFEASNKKLENEVNKISVQAKKIESENKRFEVSNTRYQKHLNLMEDTLGSAIGKINSAARRGENVSQRVLQDALNTLAKQRSVLEKMEKEVLDKQSSVMKEWAEIVEKVGSTHFDSLKQLQEAKQELSGVLGEVTSLKVVRADLEREIQKLKGVRGSLEGSADRIQRLLSVWASFLKLENGKAPGLALVIAAATWTVAKRYYGPA